MSVMAFWRPKLSRIRAAKCGSAGAFIEPSRLLYAYVNVNSSSLRSTALFQLLVDALLEGLDLGELGLDISALLQQALAVGLEHLAEALELRPLVAAGLVH